MKLVKLSRSTADLAFAKAARYIVWDADLPGFGLRISPSGTKTWVAKYRVAGGGRNGPVRWLTLGPFPLLSAAAARDAAHKALAAARLGSDPAHELQSKRKELRVRDLLDLYEKEGLIVQRGLRIGTPMKPLTARYTMSRLRNHVLPVLGAHRIADVHARDIEMLARAVSTGKTAIDRKIGFRKRVIVRGGDGAARKAVRDISAVFSFAVRHGLAQSNPVAAASVRKTDNRRERYLSLAEIGRLGDALNSLEDLGVNPKAINIARLWALTGCRRNEIAGLKWSEIDFDRGLLVFDYTKTGRSVRPLGAPALSLLEELRTEALAGHEYVFPAERGARFYQGTQQIWPRAVALADLPGVTPHVLRHTVGSAAASAGEALLMVGSLLGHKNARSTQIYAHIAYDPARMAADRITGPIATAMEIGDRRSDRKTASEECRQSPRR